MMNNTYTPISAKESSNGWVCLKSTTDTWITTPIIAYATKIDAVMAGFDEHKGEPFYVGRMEEPIQPESLWEANDWADSISSQEEYNLAISDGWHARLMDALKYGTLKAELESEVRLAIKNWMTRHELETNFYRVVDIKLVRPHERSWWNTVRAITCPPQNH